MKKIKWKPELLVFSFALIVLIFSGCGVITKTHYGNGLKLNLERAQKANHIDSNYLKAVAARKAKRLKQNQALLAQQTEKISLQVIKESKTNSPKRKSIPNSLESDYKKQLPITNHTFETPASIKLETVTEGDTTQPISGRKDTPDTEIEEHTEIAGYVFYGSIIGYILSSLLSIILFPALIYVTLLFGIGLLIGFIFAIIGLGKIKEAKKEKNLKLKGKGLAISIIVTYAIMVLYAILSIVVLLALIFSLI